MNTTSRRSFLKGALPAVAVAGVSASAMANQTEARSALKWKDLKPIVKDQMKQFVDLSLIGIGFGVDKRTIEDVAMDIDSMAHSILSPLRMNGIIHDFRVVFSDNSPKKGIKIGIKETEGKEFTIWDIDWTNNA